MSCFFVAIISLNTLSQEQKLSLLTKSSCVLLVLFNYCWNWVNQTKVKFLVPFWPYWFVGLYCKSVIFDRILQSLPTTLPSVGGCTFIVVDNVCRHRCVVHGSTEGAECPAWSEPYLILRESKVTCNTAVENIRPRYTASDVPENGCIKNPKLKLHRLSHTACFFPLGKTKMIYLLENYLWGPQTKTLKQTESWWDISKLTNDIKCLLEYHLQYTLWYFKKRKRNKIMRIHTLRTSNSI